MSDLEARLRGFDGIVVALVLIVGYVYVQALRAFVVGLVMPPLARDVDPVSLSEGVPPLTSPADMGTSPASATIALAFAFAFAEP